ncbi:MAG TPA: AraC family transcriptional regulator [Actinospica sp.]|nr:AraC family transcriptional regulator [Actinospica sp.]
MASAVEGPVRFSTAGLPDGQRIAKWEQHNADALIGLRCSSLDERTLEATEINLRLPSLQLARVIGPSHMVERTAEIIRRVPSDAIACYFMLVGDSFFYHDDGVRTLRPGQMVICDADRPFVRGFSHGLDELVVKVPRDRFLAATGIESLAEPRTVDFARGDLRARTAARLVERAVRAESRPSAVDDEVLLALLGSLVSGASGNLGAAHLAAAKTYIEENLTDVGLSAARIAEGVGLSERHLSRVFAASGSTVPRYVLGRRLHRAYLLLGAARVGSVGEVAAACGFGSAARFSSAFKERYEVGASEVLRGARAASASTMSKRTRDQD